MKLPKKIFYSLFRVRYNSREFKLFRCILINFFDHYDNQWGFHQYRITKCRLYDTPGKLIVEIHSLSPGLVVGKRGECITRLENHLQSTFKKSVHVKLEETNPFK